MRSLTRELVGGKGTECYWVIPTTSSAQARPLWDTSGTLEFSRLKGKEEVKDARDYTTLRTLGREEKIPHWIIPTVDIDLKQSGGR